MVERLKGHVRRAVWALAGDQSGAGLVEYALIIGVVAIGVVAALVFLSGGVADAFEMVTDQLEAAVTNQDPIAIGHAHGRGWCRRFGC